MTDKTEESTFEEPTIGDTTMEEQMKNSAEEQVADAQATTAGEQAGVADLTVQDLQALKVIIDVASQRGAFRPNEMTTVGATYTKLEQFLAAIAASQQNQPQEQEQAQAQG